MNDLQHSRRAFLSAASAAAAASMFPSSAAAVQPAGGTRWTIGCHTRPFSSFRLGHNELLDAINTAGYKSAAMLRASPPMPPAPPGSAPGRGGRGAAAPVTPESIAALK